MSAEDLLQWLRPFCAEDSCPVRPRIQVLQLLGQSFHLSEEDNKLLVFFRTEAILRAAWPQRQVSSICRPVFPQIIGTNNSCPQSCRLWGWSLCQLLSGWVWTIKSLLIFLLGWTWLSLLNTCPSCSHACLYNCWQDWLTGGSPFPGEIPLWMECRWLQPVLALLLCLCTLTALPFPVPPGIKETKGLSFSRPFQIPADLPSGTFSDHCKFYWTLNSQS